jgi:uncharacterized protein (TIGR02444 family)
LSGAIPEAEKAHEESPFWRFSLRLYSRPKIAAACLTLQDESGADVNLLLFLLFLAEHRRRVSKADIHRLDLAVHTWRDRVVKPLRELRRALKDGIGDIPIKASETFRGQIKRLELESERIEQHALEGLNVNAIGAPIGSRIEAAEANLAAYGDDLRSASPEALSTILAGFAEFGAHP